MSLVRAPRALALAKVIAAAVFSIITRRSKGFQYSVLSFCWYDYLMKFLFCNCWCFCCWFLLIYLYCLSVLDGTMILLLVVVDLFSLPISNCNQPRWIQFGIVSFGASTGCGTGHPNGYLFNLLIFLLDSFICNFHRHFLFVLILTSSALDTKATSF